MSKLNEDILFLIFKEFQEDSISLFSFLMVNRLWCETVIPILWRNPWCYNDINYSIKSSLFIIISHYIFNDIKEFITNQTIQLPSGSNQSLLFDYFSYCKSINVNIINSIISIGSHLDYNQFSMQQKFYSLLIRKCPELKYLDIRSIKPQTFYFPEAKDRLESLCELKCDTSIDSSYFYGLLPFCQYIQKLIIINIDSKPNHGIVKLIEAQKNLKHFEWEDDIRNSHLTKDPSEEVFRALTKKADSLNHLIIYFRCIGGFESALPQEILSKFYKLKTLVFDDLRPFTEEQLEQLRIQVYRDLEIVNLEWCGFDVITKIIENSGGCIKKILFRDNNKFRCLTFYEDSLNFIRKVYENCPLIEYLTITLSLSKKHFDEFEKLLKICQNLKSLLITIDNLYAIETDKEILEYGKIFLETLNRSAPINLQEIRFYDDFKFSLENLEEFLEKWRGRSAISILTSDSIYEGENYKKLINKYQRYGVIKDFEHNLNDYEIHYPFKF